MMHKNKTHTYVEKVFNQAILNSNKIISYVSPRLYLKVMRSIKKQLINFILHNSSAGPFILYPSFHVNQATDEGY